LTITGDDKFAWDGHELNYLDHEYNTTILNERAVEVPIAEAWHFDNEEMDPDILEVGNVLQHYGWGGHRVVDLFEEAEGVENLDARNIQGAYDRIYAISTLEHIDQETPSGAPVATALHLVGLLKPGGKMLATVPFGQQPFLDVAILQGDLCADREWTMVRADDTGEWVECAGARVWAHARENSWARAVWVAEWTKGAT
jgi:hypothetical protein